MIKLTSVQGSPIVINPDYIIKFYEENEKQIVIVMTEGTVSVKGTVDEILNLIKFSKIGLDNYPYAPPNPYPPFIPDSPDYEFPGINPNTPIGPIFSKTISGDR